MSIEPQSPFDEEQSLLKKTRALLIASKKSIEAIVKETGLPYHWLVNLQKAQNKSAGVNRIQFLWEHLSGRKLEV